MHIDSADPLVSITLPLAEDASPKLLEICLGALARQTYTSFEVLILISDKSSPELLEIAEGEIGTHIFRGSFTKSGARNFLANEAIGRYLLYIDVDMELSSHFLAECISVATARSSRAVVAPAREAPSPSFWSKCRGLERELLRGDVATEVPLFLDKGTFDSVGQFDEKFDMFDDWALTLKLMRAGINFDSVEAYFTIRETTNLIDMFRRKYMRGQEIPALRQTFPELPQLRFWKRFVRSYVGNWRKLLRSPVHATGLMFLKVIDMAGLFFGSLNPVERAPVSGAEIYHEAGVAQSYDKNRLGSNFNRYKHYSEIQSLLELLDPASKSLLEVGCGTGRVTQIISAKGFSVLPLEPSLEMMKQFTAKSSMPRPIRGDGLALPFRNTCFDIVYALRVIWHLPSYEDYESFISEMARVTSQTVIVDFANKQRWEHPFIKFLATVLFAFRPRDRQAHRISQLFNFPDFSLIATDLQLSVKTKLPLDVLSPLWLNIIPRAFATAMFPTLRRVELLLSKVIPPGRFLVELVPSGTETED